METTGAFALSLPMIIAVIGAAVVTRLMRTPSLGHGLEIALVASGRRMPIGVES
jgi:H+/Cl- antiporter ClcA